MEHASIEPAIKLIIAEVHNKLSEAARIAKAAEACAMLAASPRVSKSPYPRLDQCRARSGIQLARCPV